MKTFELIIFLRYPTYNYVKNVLEGLIKDFPTTVNNARREKDQIEIHFVEPVDVELSPVSYCSLE